MSRRARRPRRRVASRVRDYARGLLAFLFSNVGIIVLVVAYTIAGAFMFQAIEGAGEVERANNMTRERNNTADYLWENVTIALNLFNDTALKERIGVELVKYQRKVVVAARGGWDGGAGGHSSRQWSFSSAFLYSLTVITTIGYGHLSPRTNWGKVTTILYALLGMPLFLLYLSNVGELLARWFKCLYALVCLCRGCPGFTRRRITRFRHPIEMSEAESIERPQAWRSRYSDSDVTPEQRIPPYPRGYQRKAEYFRSASMPQPWESGRHPPPLPPPPPLPAEPRRMAPPHWEPRGLAPPRWERRTPAPPHWEPRGPAPPHWEPRGPAPPHWEPRGPARPHWEPPRGHSEPLGFRSGTNNSSEFSYVTFDAQAITVPISVCVSIMVGYLLFGSMIFGMWEKWDQLDGAYFCFISLSSIGFGDFVPGERVYSARIEPSFIVCSLYLMLGMALVAMCFNLMQEQVIHYFAGLKRALKRICRCKR